MEKILSLTAKNFIWDFVRGSGKGGQKRNKTCSAVRCRHLESGALGWCEDGRSQLHNRQEAFKKCIETKEFKNWMRIEIAKKQRDYVSLEQKVDELMEDKYLKIETFIPKEER